MKLFIHFVFPALFASFAFAANEDLEIIKFFDHPSCAVFISSVMHERGSSYRRKAEAFGLTGHEADIYVYRRAYNRFLRDRFDASWSEYEHIENTTPTTAYRLQVKIQLRQQLIDRGEEKAPNPYLTNPIPALVELYKSAGNRKRLEDELPLSAIYPFSYQILATRPPAGKFETLQFEILVFLRSLVAFHHSRLAQQYLALPIVDINKLAMSDIQHAFDFASMETSAYYLTVVPSEAKEEIELFRDQMERQKIDFEVMAKALLKDSAIPAHVQKEIALQMALERDFRVPRSRALQLYIGWVHRYFKDTQLE